MGHYDSCYEAEEERERPYKEKRRIEDVAKIQAMLDEYGLAETLYRLTKEGY